jgi:thermostable 8-oxoguanine DNA glycosylase
MYKNMYIFINWVKLFEFSITDKHILNLMLEADVHK